LIEFRFYYFNGQKNIIDYLLAILFERDILNNKPFEPSIAKQMLTALG
jgi:hypothetical protein